MVRCLPGGSQGDDATAYPVEEYALHEYARDGYAGVHAEGSITSTLFALLFWDVIFTPVPDVFRNQYQVQMEGVWEDLNHFIVVIFIFG